MHRLTKDPNAILDYGFDWSEWLDADDEITASTWLTISPGTVPALAYVAGSQTFTADQTKVKLSGGKVGTTYTVTNRIETSEGLTDDRSLIIEVQER